MQVRRIQSDQELATLANAWDELAGDSPFRSHLWLCTWWRHYRRQGDELYVLAASEAGRLVGIAPWFKRRRWSAGHSLMTLGSGEICSEDVGLLADTKSAEAVAEAIADWLHATSYAASQIDYWDQIVLDSVRLNDCPLVSIVRHLRRLGHAVESTPTEQTWALTLAGSSDEVMSGLSARHRKHLRRSRKLYFDSGRARVIVPQNNAELEQAWRHLMRLHQARWQSLGEPGSFASTRFESFHREIVGALFPQGQATVWWLELDGEALAAEYQLLGGSTVYAYQGGIDTERLRVGPGNLANLASVRLAIEQGYKTLDFLRGDEPYKAHWRAQPQPTARMRVAGQRATSRARFLARRVWTSAKGLVAGGRRARARPRMLGE